MYVIIRTALGLSLAEAVVGLYTFEADATEAWENLDEPAELIALTEYAEARIIEALREHEEMVTTLRTGVHRKARGA
jgi:hypothetical protein